MARELKSVEAMSSAPTQLLLPDTEAETADDENG
jgi:hypothetical protein